MLPDIRIYHNIEVQIYMLKYFMDALHPSLTLAYPWQFMFQIIVSHYIKIVKDT